MRPSSSSIQHVLLVLFCQGHALAVQLQPGALQTDRRLQTGIDMNQVSSGLSRLDRLRFTVMTEIEEAQWANLDGATVTKQRAEGAHHLHGQAIDLSPSLIASAVNASQSASLVALNMSKQFSRPVLVIDDLLRMDVFDEHRLLSKLGEGSKVVAQLPDEEVAMLSVKQVRQLVRFVEYARALDMDRLRVEANTSLSDCPQCNSEGLLSRAIARFSAQQRSSFSRAQEAVGVCSLRCYSATHAQMDWRNATAGAGKCGWSHCTGCQECRLTNQTIQALAFLAAEQYDETAEQMAQILHGSMPFRQEGEGDTAEISRQPAQQARSVQRYLEIAQDANANLSTHCQSWCGSMPGTWKHKCDWSELSQFCGGCSVCLAGKCSANCYSEEHVSTPWQPSPTSRGRCAWFHCNACNECQAQQMET